MAPRTAPLIDPMPPMTTIENMSSDTSGGKRSARNVCWWYAYSAAGERGEEPGRRTPRAWRR